MHYSWTLIIILESKLCPPPPPSDRWAVLSFHSSSLVTPQRLGRDLRVKEELSIHSPWAELSRLLGCSDCSSSMWTTPWCRGGSSCLFLLLPISAWPGILSLYLVSKCLLSHDGVSVVSSGAEELSICHFSEGVISPRGKPFVTKPSLEPLYSVLLLGPLTKGQLLETGVGSGKLVQNLDRFMNLTGNSWKIASIKKWEYRLVHLLSALCLSPAFYFFHHKNLTFSAISEAHYLPDTWL